VTGEADSPSVPATPFDPSFAATLAGEGAQVAKDRRKREASQKKEQARAAAAADKKAKAARKVKAEAEKKARAAAEKKAKAAKKAKSEAAKKAKSEAAKKAKLEAKAQSRGAVESPSQAAPEVIEPEGAGAGDDPKWRRRKDSRPEELIAAALEIFGRQGFARTNLKDVAKHAGVSKGTVYLYFKNKEDLLLAAVQKSVVPILDFADDYEIDSDSSATDMLRTLVRRWLTEFEARSVAGLPKLVVAEAGNFPELAQLFVDAVLQRARRLFKRVLKRGVRAGEFRDIDVRQAVHVLLAPVIWLQIHQFSLGPHDEGFEDVSAFLETHVEIFLAGIRAKP